MPQEVPKKLKELNSFPSMASFEKETTYHRFACKKKLDSDKMTSLCRQTSQMRKQIQ